MATKKNEVAVEEVETNMSELMTDIDFLDEFRAEKGEKVEGLEVIDETDIKLPRIKISQFNSAEVMEEKSEAGHFFNTVTGEHSETLDCVLLVLGKSRVMWPATYKTGEDPLCRSTDGIMGETKEGVVRPCKGCPFQDWNLAKAEGKDRPDCRQGYVWLGMTSKGPFRMTAGGASAVPTKNFLNDIFPRRYPAYIYNVQLSTKKEKNDKGVFFTLQYKIVGTAPSAEEAHERKGTAEAMQDLFMEAMAKDIVTVDVAENIPEGTGENGKLF